MVRAPIVLPGTCRSSLYYRSTSVLLLTLLAMPAIGEILIDGEPALRGEFLTLDEIPIVSAREERIAAYQDVLKRPATTAEEQRFSIPSFVEAVVDFSTLVEPKKALTTARLLLWRTHAMQVREPEPAPVTAAVYERLGVALLSAARLARFGGDLEQATGHLRTARHVFDLADREALGAGKAEVGEVGSQNQAGMDLLHRAMVGLEEILITDSRDAWPEAAGLLTRQLDRSPSGPLADWVLRILHHPETYVGEEDVMGQKRYQVGGMLRKPVKIFAPRALYTSEARRGHIQGVVITQAVIDRHGHIAGLKAVKGLPMGLTDEGLRTMATWLFEPATLEGRPVTVSYFLTMKFQL